MRPGTRLCTRHAVGDILHATQAAGTVFRAQCSCGWSTPWWSSVIALLADVHAHRYPRRGHVRFERRLACERAS